MYSQQRNRPNPSINAARLAAEAAFSAPPETERPPEIVSNALVIVKKKRSLDPDASAGAAVDLHPDESNRGPRVFRVPTAALAERDAHGVDGHLHPTPIDGGPSRSGPGSEPGLASHVHGAEEPRIVQRRARRSAVAKPGPVVTIVAAPARESVDLAALARELQANANAREHAAEQEQLGRLQAQMTELDSVLAQIAKARAFTLNDMALSDQWQQLDRAAQQLGVSFEDGLTARSLAGPKPQSFDFS